MNNENTYMEYNNMNKTNSEHYEKMSASTTPAMENKEGMYNHGCGCPCPCPSPIVCPPVYECPINKCVHRNIFFVVPHVCPVNTKIINHHIYKHTYSPEYTCCEENETCNIQEGNCCNFK